MRGDGGRRGRRGSRAATTRSRRHHGNRKSRARTSGPRSSNRYPPRACATTPPPRHTSGRCRHGLARIGPLVTADEYGIAMGRRADRAIRSGAFPCCARRVDPQAAATSIIATTTHQHHHATGTTSTAAAEPSRLSRGPIRMHRPRTMAVRDGGIRDDAAWHADRQHVQPRRTGVREGEPSWRRPPYATRST